MDKKQFYNEYKEVFNLDNIKWDMPKYGVKGFVKNLPFKVQVSLKNEIDMDSLFYVMGGYIYHLDLAFLRPELDDRTRFPDIKIGKLNAIEIDSVYLIKHELDVKSSFKFNTKNVETSQFPIMDKYVKPINDYVEKKEDLAAQFLEDNKNKIDAINALGKSYDFKLPIIGEIKFSENGLTYKEGGNINNFPELETFEAANFGRELIEHQSPEKFHNTVDINNINKRFNDCIDNRLNECKELLLVKSVEYRRNGNPYHNFNVGAKFTGESSEKVLYGFLLKHLISLQDIVNDVNENKLPSKEIIAAKVSDIINYMLILEALIEEKRNNNENI